MRCPIISVTVHLKQSQKRYIVSGSLWLCHVGDNDGYEIGKKGLEGGLRGNSDGSAEGGGGIVLS